MAKIETPYTYVFVRSDISPEQQIIQAGHACLYAGQKFDHSKPSHMVLIEAKSEEDLIRISEHLGFNEIDHVMFHEPDISSYTAIASEPLRGAERTLLRRYNTYKIAED